MNKTKKMSFGGAKKKLMGAVCMLLVASIMMISATYAWFTLSTAPEITGITTSVGANGNLEMALLDNTTYNDLTKIKSAVGDSKDTDGKSITEANITWGNLVDLSDTSYGTSSFKLNPSIPVVGSDGVVSTTTPLATASYGTDGRVKALEKNTVTGIYDAEKGAFYAAGKGVRGIGVASAMTPQQQAFRVAVANVAADTAVAKTTVQNALNMNGSALGSLAVNMANNDSYAVTTADIAAINSVIDSVTTAKAKLGEAIKYAMMAETVAKNADASKELTAYSLEGYTGTTSAITSAIAGYNAIVVPANLEETANTAAAKEALKDLLDTDHLTLNGYTMAEVKNNIGAIAKAAMTQGGLVLVMDSTNTGSFQKIAAMAGNISAKITLAELKHGDVSMTDVDATMRTATAGGATIMATLYSALSAIKVEGNVEAADTVISDLYGYAIDMAFRTNAAGSKLLLQTDAAQRIYSDAIDTSTQGGGSYMEFTPTSLNNNQFKGLLSSVKVLFLDESNKILAVAGLDTSSLRDAEGTAAAVAGKFPLKMVTTTFVDVNDTSKTMLTVTPEEESGRGVITDLQQNAATRISVMVYLDGASVDNSMVSVDAQSMTGRLNLQFSSSASLVPMDYTPLHNRKVTGDTGDTGGGNTEP